MQITKEKVRAYIEIVKATADAIRELKEVPNGELYARVMSHVSFDQYCAIILTLKNSGVIRETNNILIWNVEDKKCKE
jgi:transcriptional regulator CtsR